MILKWFVPIAFAYPQGSTRSSTFFWYQMKAHIFLIITPKFQLRIHCTLAVVAENVPFSSIPILIFSCIFITVSPQCHILIFASGEKTRSNEVKLYKMCLRGQCRSVKSENTHVKMGTTLFKKMVKIRYHNVHQTFHFHMYYCVLYCISFHFYLYHCILYNISCLLLIDWFVCMQFVRRWRTWPPMTAEQPF